MNNSTELEREILRLKAQKANDLAILKSQMSHSYEELKPSKIVQRVFVDLKEEPKIKDNVLNSIVSLAAGYVTKRLLVGKSNSFFKAIIGYLVQIGATKIVSNQIITDNNNK